VNDIQHVEVSREEWGSFCTTFTRRHSGWLVEVDVSRNDGPAELLAAEAPLQRLDLADPAAASSSDSAVSPELRVRLDPADGSAIEVAVQSPTRLVELVGTGGERAGLRVEPEDGGALELRFLNPAHPETVDGIA
jgi:hypothetical protein